MSADFVQQTPPEGAPGQAPQANPSSSPPPGALVQPAAKSLYSLHTMLMALVAVALVPFLLVSVWGHLAEREHERGIAVERTAHAAVMIADDLVRETRNTRLSLELLAANPRLWNCSSEQSGAACAQELQHFASLAPEYLNLILARSGGTVLASANPLEDKNGILHIQAVVDALHGQAFAVSVSRQGLGQASEPNAAAVITYAAPVRDAKDGAPLVIAAQVALTQASKTIESAGLPQGTSVVLADLSGRIIFRIPDAQGYVGVKLPAGHLDFIRTRTSQASGWGVGLDGVERYYVLRRVDIGGEPIGYVRVGIPKSAVYAESTAKLMRQVALLVFTTLLVLLLTRLWAGRFLLDPVRRLMAAVRALGAGDFTARTGMGPGTPGTTGELGELARTFDNMAEGLECAQEEQEAARKALRESEERLRAVFNASSDGLLLLVPDGRVLSMNESAAKRRNATSQELEGKNILDIIPQYVRNGRRERFEEVVRTCAPLRFEEEREGRTYAIRLYPIFGEDGAVRQIASFSRDITERRLSERALVEAKTAAEAASMAKAAFMANMSHELRSPLNGLAGMLRLLEDAKLTNEHREYLDYALKTSNHLTELISDILDYAALGSGQVVMEHKPFTLGAVLTSLEEELQPVAEGKGLTFTVNGHQGALEQPLLGDPLRLGQALRHLLDNALKFTHEGGVTLDAVLSCKAVGDCTLRLQVADTGIGIAPEQMQKLFEPFVQAEDPLTKRYPGTGLGLAIVHELVAKMGGQVEAQSDPGSGSVFTLCVSFQTPADAHTPQDWPTPPA
jgi:PAS domain S-box-containing protein